MRSARLYRHGMVRLVVLVAVCAFAFVVIKQRTDGVTAGGATAPQVQTAEIPEQFRDVLAEAPDPAKILRERGALPGLGAIRRLAGDGSDGSPEPEARSFADVGSRRELNEVRRDIRRDLSTLNRLTTMRGAEIADAERALSAVYSAAVLERLGSEGRRAFAERLLGRTQAMQRIKVVEFDGIFVSGTRALAHVVYRLSTRAPSGRFVARSPEVWTVTLTRQGGRWRFVRGFESD
jgi:hypothetical protein